LAGNAIKFTDAGGVAIRVTLESQRENGITLHFAVSDTGCGIPSGKLDHIFGAFSQADSSVTRKYGGTGLGLAISKNFVELMGGRIWVESELGKGSTFHFTANFGFDKTSAVSVPEAGNEARKNAPEPYELTKVLQLETRRPLRILLAEDNSVNQHLTTRVLEKYGHEIETVANGREALTRFEAGQSPGFDVILMDIQMPEMDGFEATAAIRDLERTTGEHVRIIAMTARVMESDRARCLSVGMDGYVSKPISAEELNAALVGI
jgi:CheY-like chemotaxis protein